MHALGREPLHGGGPGLGDERPRERACRQVGAAREVLDGLGLVEVLVHPGEHVADALLLALRYGAVDVLALAAVALGRDDHAARDRVGRRAAELLAHDVQARVDPRGRARARDDVAVVDEQDVRVHLDLRVAGRELVGVAPVRRDAAPVDEPRLGEQERARADAQQDGAARVCCAQGVDDLLRVLVADGHRGDRDQVRVLERVETVVGDQRGAHARADRDSRDRAADAEVDQGHAVVRAVEAEDLAHDAELERGQSVGHDGRHGAQHPSTLRRWQDLVDTCLSCHSCAPRGRTRVEAWTSWSS